jgi:5-methylcytosine-specific restriction endonuclease McrA
MAARKRWSSTRRWRELRAYMISRALQRGEVCGICGRPLQPGQKLHLDHVLPRSWGGMDYPSNLRVSHATCNLRRGNQLRIRPTSRAW